MQNLPYILLFALRFGVFFCLTMYPAFPPISIQIKRSPSFPQLYRTPCADVPECIHPDLCGHFGNFQYFAKSGHVVMSDRYMYTLLL